MRHCATLYSAARRYSAAWCGLTLCGAAFGTVTASPHSVHMPALRCACTAAKIRTTRRSTLAADRSQPERAAQTLAEAARARRPQTNGALFWRRGARHDPIQVGAHVGGDVVGVAEAEEVADLVQGGGLEIVAVPARQHDLGEDDGRRDDQHHL